MDFRITGCATREQVSDTLERYVRYYNEQRPCYAIGYDTPLGFRMKFMDGKILQKDTFSKRELSEIHKFLRLKKKKCWE